ncbi:MAG: Gfo/Idh/MocA family oxidoreductase [Victivallaceae bacterium]|nr:Gfo/Idh/MocA family oxidoreductase [Victivallaceae bacterium]
MKQVKFGIIGIGNMGSMHTNFVSALPEAKLTAVCDLNPEAFKRIAPDILKKVKTFTDDEKFFAEADVDVVMVAVPHYFHPDLAIRAMECGKHIIVEKPIAVHKAEAERLIAACGKYPKLIKSAMFNQRTRPAHRKIKQLIDSGELGAVRRVNWIITDWFRTQHYYDSGDWRASWRGEGGGVLLNQCPHQLDLMQWLFGLPTMVQAHVKLGKYHDIEVEDEVNAYLEYADGKVGNFIASTGEAPGTNRLEITAERGRLVFENGKIEFIRNEEETSTFCRTTSKSFDTPARWNCEIPYGNAPMPEHQEIIRNVTAAILHGEKLFAPLEEGIRGLELGNAILLSGLKDKAVTLPIDSREYADMLAGLVKKSRYRKTVKKAKNAAADGSFANSFGK